LRNAGFKDGIFSGLALGGCSSMLISTSPALPLTATGVISQSNRLAFAASSARDSEASA
jgi:hypothetical protein